MTERVLQISKVNAQSSCRYRTYAGCSVYSVGREVCVYRAPSLTLSSENWDAEAPGPPTPRDSARSREVRPTDCLGRTPPLSNPPRGQVRGDWGVH